VDNMEITDVPQPPKQSAYTQPSNPVSRNPEERRGQAPTDAYLSSSSRYGDAPPAIRRTAASKPSSGEKLAQLEEVHRQDIGPDGKRGHIDLEFGVEQQPAEGDIAAAVEGRPSRVQPGAHAGPVGSTPGFEQDTAAQMERKRAEHDRALREGGRESSARYGEEAVDAECRQVRERKLKLDQELDVKGAVKGATGDRVV
ncbi:hypothetical protein BGW36DRAFT_303494, partial [Talaromyces proteolyticus]